MNANSTAPFVPSGTAGLVAPEFRGVLEHIPNFSITAETLGVAREAVAALGQQPLPEDLASVTTEERFIDGPEPGQRLRLVLLRPAAGLIPAGPAVLHIHGGAFIVGSPEMETVLSRRVAHDVGCMVVSVEYRLAPEATYPAAIEDCYSALGWMHQHCAELDIDPARIAILGTSAGGGHAAALAISARDKGEYPICFQVLDQPMLDDRTGSTADPHPYAGEFGHTAVQNRFGWQALLGTEPGSDDVPAGAVPARTADLSGLPPAFLSIGGLDLFLDETINYAQRLLRAGVAAELHVFPGGFHGWEMAEAAPQTQSLRALRRDALARAFAIAATPGKPA
jgi:acetyl esterase/lipase